jgi:hypothetical protein
MVSLQQEIPNQPPSFLWDEICPIGNVGSLKINEGTMWDYISTNSDKFSIYKHLVSISQLNVIFNNVQTDFTFFIPLDTTLLEKHPENVYLNMGKNQAINIINFNTLSRNIDAKTIKSSKRLKLVTRIRGQLIYTNIVNNTILLNNIPVINEDIIVNNGIVHWTKDFCIPDFVA